MRRFTRCGAASALLAVAGGRFRFRASLSDLRTREEDFV